MPSNKRHRLNFITIWIKNADTRLADKLFVERGNRSSANSILNPAQKLEHKKVAKPSFECERN